MKRRALVLLALLACGAAYAQPYGQVDFITSGLVSFNVTAEDYARALACAGCNYLYPTSGTEIVLGVHRQNPNRHYTLEALHSGFSPANPLNLEARYTVTNDDGNRVLLSTHWLPITEVPTQLFTEPQVGNESRVRVEVEYRLRVTGNETAGTFPTRVTHRIRQNNSAVTHDLRAVLPWFVALRLVRVAVPGVGHTVRFDYGGALQAYAQAVSSGIPLTMTSSDLERVEISTNHPGGYTVTVTVSESSGPAGGAPLRDRLLLAGQPAHGRQFGSNQPTSGFVTLVRAAQFELRVDGGEAPGAYQFVVTYHVTSP